MAKDYKKTKNKSNIEAIKDLPDVDRILRSPDAVDRCIDTKMNEAEWYHGQLQGKPFKDTK